MGISSIVGWSLFVYVLRDNFYVISFFLDLSVFLRYNKRVTFKEVRKTLETSFVRSRKNKLGT